MEEKRTGGCQDRLEVSYLFFFLNRRWRLGRVCREIPVSDREDRPITRAVSAVIRLRKPAEGPRSLIEEGSFRFRFNKRIA